MHRHFIGLLVSISVSVVATGCSDGTKTAAADAHIVDAAPPDSRGDGPAAKDGPAPRDARLDGLTDAPGPGPDSGPVDTQPDLPACSDPGVVLSPGVTVSPTQLVAGQNVTVRYSGLLASTATTVRLHYSFDNWSWTQPAGAPYAQAKQVAMHQVAGGVWEVDVPIIAGAHQLDFVFTDQNASNWDNNGKRDWHRPIGGLWMGPYLTWRDNLLTNTADRDPAKSIVVNFRSWRSCQARVRWGTSPTALTQQLDESLSGELHHMLLTGLAPQTTYYYQIGCLDGAATCPFLDHSATYSFRTLSATTSQLKLIVLADPQNYDHPQDRWQDVAQALAQGPAQDAQAVLIAGDLSADDDPVRWRAFFRLGRPLLARLALLPAVGNHDTPTFGSHKDTSTFEALFSMSSSSGKDTYYGVKAGPLTVFALNSEMAQASTGSSDWQAPNGAQYSWLATRLLAVQTPWTFVFFHIGPFNAGVRHASQNDTTRTIIPLLDKRVDWVFSGHEHLYQRTQPLRYTGTVLGKPQVSTASSYGTSSQDGVGYLIIPAAGHYPPEDQLLPASNPLRALLAYPTSADIVADALKAPWVGYTIVSLDGKAITLDTFELGQSQPRDSVAYTKP